MSNPAISQKQGSKVPAMYNAAKDDIKRHKASAPASKPVFEPPKSNTAQASKSNADTIAPKAHPTKQTANVPLLEDKKEPEKPSHDGYAGTKTPDDSSQWGFEIFG